MAAQNTLNSDMTTEKRISNGNHVHKVPIRSFDNVYYMRKTRHGSNEIYFSTTLETIVGQARLVVFIQALISH